jgi:tyrosyl-tRNA synthetase
MEVTELVHGLSEAKRARTKSAVLYDHHELDDLSVADIESAFQGDDRLVRIADRSLLKDIVALAVHSGATKSSSAAIKLIKAGGLYVNNQKWQNGKREIDDSNGLIENRLLLLRTGKSNYRICLFDIDSA